MADNTTLPSGTGGDTIRSRDRSGAGPKVQVVALDLNGGGATEVLDTAVALADATANPTLAQRAAMMMGFNGSTWDRLRTLAAGVLRTVNDESRASSLAVPATGTAGAAVTLTLAAAGVGLFHYITSIQIVMYASAARTGAAAPIVVTSTNIPGPLAWTCPTAQAIGTQDRQDIALMTPIKSSAANTATTIVCPATPSVIWRVNVTYFVGA